MASEPVDVLAANAAPTSSLGRSIVLVVAICLLLLGGVFRATAVGDHLWLDEQHTAWVAKGDLTDVARRAAAGNQTPLYFYAVWAALKVGGVSAPALRLPGLVCGMALMTIVPILVYRRTSSTAALLLVAAFFAFDYDCVFYTSEARPYVMVQLLGGVQAIVFFDWVSAMFNLGVASSLKRSLATAVLAALIFYTHPTGMLLMSAELIFVCAVCVWRQSFPWRPLIATASFCGVLVSPGIALIGFLWQRRENWTAVSDVDNVFMSLIYAVALMMLLPLAMLLIDRWKDRTRPPSRGRPERPWLELAFVACWAIVPKLMIVVLDAVGWVSLAIDRYAIVGAIAFPLFAALAISSVRNDALKWSVALAIVGAIACTSQVPQQLQSGGFRHENWHQVVAIINREDESLPVFLVANLIEDRWAQTDQTDGFQQYLKFPLRGIPEVISPKRIVARPSQGEIFSPDNIRALVEHDGGLVVIREAEVYRDAIRLEITAALQSHPQTKSALLFAAPIERPSPNNVHLFLIKLPTDQDASVSPL